MSATSTRASTTELTPATRLAKRLGRPPRVDRTQIAQAALTIGLDQATIRNVADHLGMSVPGLYHHVRSRQELLALAATHELGELRLPEDHGQHWTAWLLEYARFVYDALVRQPEVVAQVMAASVDTLRQAQHVERFIGFLDERGVANDDAHRIYRQLNSAVIGAAVAEVARRTADGAGRSELQGLARAVDVLGPESLPHVRALVDHSPTQRTDSFTVVELFIRGLEATQQPEAR